jgi:nicotinamide riboside transporter PnuC
MPWIATILSIIGTIANIYKKRYGFVLWIIADIIWIDIDYQAGLHEQAGLFLFFAILAMWGYIQWKEG